MDLVKVEIGSSKPADDVRTLPASVDEFPQGTLPDESEKTPTNAPSTDIPNGGWNAWMQVFGASLLVFNSWGIVNSFGAYQTYYETSLLKSSTSSAISWIGTVQAFLLILTGVLSGPLYDRGYIRSLTIAGTVLLFFGMMMTSLISRYWEAFLAQGVVTGLGLGCLYVPGVAIVATYFSTKRAIAVGLASSGGSLGGVIYPIMFRRLQSDIGFGWATRIIAFVALVTQLISLAILKARILPNKPRALLEPAAFKDPPYTMFTAGFFIVLLGLYVPFFYITAYSERIIHTSADFAFYLLAVMNASSFFGRIFPPLVAGKIGAFNTTVVCLFLTAIITFTWISVESVAGVVLFSIFYGFFSGSILALPPTVLVSLSPDVYLAGTRIGMCFGLAGFGLLIGNPIAGTILNIPQGKFRGAQIFAATTIIAGSALVLVARLLRLRSHKTIKM